MRFLVTLLSILAVAVVTGLGLTWYTAARAVGFGNVVVGPWTANVKSGTQETDPYTRASVARAGELPLALGDGVAFIARTDSKGAALDGRCDIRLGGPTPPARYWTLTLYDPAGHLLANSVNRHGFTSQEVLRDAAGAFNITAAPRARAGNWLPTGGATRYVLVMRFYDTPSGVSTRNQRELQMPSIVTESCREPPPMMRLPLVRLAYWLIAGLMLGALVHLGSVMLLPHVAMLDAYSRLAPVSAANAVANLPLPSPDAEPLPFMDPAFAIGICRYDLSAGPLKISVPLGQSYTSLAFYTRQNVAYYAINDRSAARGAITLDLMTAAQHAEVPEEEDVTRADRLIVESPSNAGLVVFRSLAPEPDLLVRAQQVIAAARCGPDAPEPTPAPAPPVRRR